MKITSNYFTRPVDNKKPVAKTAKTEGAQGASFKSQLSNVDSLTISAPKDKIAESQFISSLKNQISAEVKADKTPQVVGKLEDQVASGEYTINSDNIAKKLLLQGLGK